MNTNNKPSTAGRTTADDILQRDARFRYMLLARMQSDCEYIWITEAETPNACGQVMKNGKSI